MARSWRWFRTRLEGLATRPHSYAMTGQPVWATRIQQIVNNPADEDGADDDA